MRQNLGPPQGHQRCPDGRQKRQINFLFYEPLGRGAEPHNNRFRLLGARLTYKENDALRSLYPAGSYVQHGEARDAFVLRISAMCIGPRVLDIASAK
jgi:hypothetical protein